MDKRDIDKFNVPEGITEEFKLRYVKDVGLGVAPHETIQDIVDGSYAYVAGRCGYFDITENQVGRELVFERARYVHNNAAELFYENFFSELADFSWSLRMEGEANEPS